MKAFFFLYAILSLIVRGFKKNNTTEKNEMLA